jgi:histidinol-phosphate aminotransferase
VSGPTPKIGVLGIAPYIGARAEASAPAYQLASNESAIGPSADAIEAYRSAASAMHLYPEGSCRELRRIIGEIHDLDPARVVCGNGSDELLALIGHAFLRPRDEVLHSEHAFLVYRMIAAANDAAAVAVPEPDLRVDVDRMLAAVTPRARIVFVANPNNPTGTYICGDELRRLHAALSSETLLVIDSAYAEFLHGSDYESGAELVRQFDNVVMTRTFSKAYALAGLRIGWAFCPENVADVLNRVRGPFNVSVAAQQAAAAALRDRAHLVKAIAHNDKWREWLTREIRKLGLRVDDSAGNFVLIQFQDAETAKAADRFLMQCGVILRPTGAYGLPHCLRMTLGLEDANRAAVAALRDFMRA